MAGNRYSIKKKNPEQCFACKEENASSCITRRGGTNTGRKPMQTKMNKDDKQVPHINSRHLSEV